MESLWASESFRAHRSALAGLSWRRSGPAFECVRECTDFSVSKEPRDLGNLQFLVPQIAPGKVGLHFFQNAGERQSFRG